MKLVRVKMLKTRDSLQAGNFYNLPRLTAFYLIEQGDAESQEMPRVGPTETKPVEPTEVKVVAKKKRSHAQTEKGF